MEGLPDDERLFYCYIVNKVRFETRKEPTQFKGISSTYFQNFIGSRYRQYINQLRDWRIIHISEHYQNADGHGFPKAYRLHRSALESPFVKVRFQKKQAHSLEDHSILTDEMAEFVLANCKRVGIKTDLAPQMSDVDEVDAEDFAERIFYGQYNVRYGRKVIRLYHTIIEMPSAARTNLVFSEDPTVHLCEYDVKSCHPVLLLSIMEDKKEKDALRQLLNGDIYTTIANESGVTDDRDTIKKDFLKFANGKTRNYFHRYFRKHFPRVTQYIDEHKDGVAAWGQNGEALIMVKEVPQWLMGSAGSRAAQSLNTKNSSKSSLTSWGNPEDILYVPMHDGWLGIEREEMRIGNFVRDRFYEHTQFWVTITKKDLVTGNEATLMKGAPAVPVEQVTWHR